jgi:hypothetical protein
MEFPMLPRRLLVAALLLLGMAVATFEESFIHSDDGCVVETHCQACLLRLGTTGVVTVAFSLPRAVAVVDRVAPAPPASPDEGAPPPVASRGPPQA